MYRPKIYAELLPALFETAKSRQVPVTRLTNAYVYRALQTEYLPASAIEALPTPADFKSHGVGNDTTNLPVGELKLPYNQVSELAAGAKPFVYVTEITDWYQNTIDGTARALKLAQNNSYAPCLRKPSDLNIQWRYENLAVSLNQILAETLSQLGAFSCRSKNTNGK